MPCIIRGSVIIENNSGTIVQCARTISPISASKTISGSGGGNTGSFIIINNFVSITNKF